MTGIPLVDLGAQHEQVAEEVDAGWADVLKSTAFIGGPQVATFEAEFAEYSGVRHCVGVGSGTDALELALRALGLEHGSDRDECVLPANTFVATAEAVVRAGGRPVLVDCEADTGLIDVHALAGALGPRTRAVIPVHLYGQTAPVELIRPLARAAGAAVVEDAAQAQGARRHGVCAGGLGDVAATSFYPGKNLGAYGDGGAVLTGDPELARRVRLLREHGSPRKYEHTELGFNSRLDTLQAVVLSAKLRRLSHWNAARRTAAARYARLLSRLPAVRGPVVLEGNEPVWHLYVVRVPARDRVLELLRAEGIGAGVHYPTPLHLTGAFGGLGHGEGDFPVAERLAGKLLSLPLFPEITGTQQERVVEVLGEALEETS
ncbi:DegT/DnrJ/EryC1/StrS family aminotransferase [Amycolatopsis cihanbeyliensis]|uniref:dTDP-4-amino-4,6-dideoxygalactose transaminase n=1 Tax=Amycolatopsis cihanbeyliensis TaxID=1128664 RepID=A0A542DFI5_AMYCI|nr:DegT/DnrJ/EryC1/StrS family aminotransferase [Amycolatopsis cihanbeyliensis]TQJ01833.1 dTDP-4-amino-4,6-dideoxygalactose transaminase [Amycolatopsis cihanbeyliensis]